jgi:hypothetical protein
MNVKTQNMKRNLLIILFSFGLALGASAQRGGFHGGVAVGGHYGYYGGGYGYYPRTYVGVGFGLGYPWWGWGYGWYGPWYGGYPAYYYGYGAMPNQLELQVQDIKNDYEQQIKDVRHDKALTHKERRAKIDQLKIDRDNAIIQARHDYFYHSRQRYPNQAPNQQNQQQPNQNQQNQEQPKSNSNGSSSSDGPEYQEQAPNK